MNFQAMSRQRKFLLITAAVGVLSIFLPWHTVGGIFQGININGFHGLGVLVFFLFAGTGALAFIGDQAKPLDKKMWLITLAAGAIAVLIVIARLAGAGDAFGITKPGIGLWLALAVSLCILAFAWMYKNPGDTLQNAFDSLKENISATTAGTTSKPPTGSSKIDELEKLIELKNQGKITDDEYQSLKSKMI
jgi:hypothetical protein